jgi:16S rRNA A1518/A1519 N6-dimethyltransferase RsmA/KsgA/DIM1 with predicted DNA glycosylase/AP lyase activity
MDISPTFDQHMIRDMTSYERLLQSLDIGGRMVVEFGVGTGSLTRAIMAQSPTRIVGYEIDGSLVPEDIAGHPLMDLRMKDFTREDFGFLSGSRYALISNPPYSELAFIRDFIERHPPEILLLMVSERKKDVFFPDDKVALSFRPDDFTPPTNGGHVVVVRTRS